MAIALVGTATNTTYASRTNTAVTAPTGLADGNVVLASVLTGAAGTAPTVTAPAGGGTFTLLTGFPVSLAPGGFNVKWWIWRKVASGEGASWTFTHTAASSQGWAIAYSGVDTTTPLDATNTTNNGTGATSTATGLTTVTNAAQIIFAGVDYGDTANNLTPPTGTTPTFTEQLDIAPLIYLADGNLATAGATGNKTMTSNSTGTSPWGAALIALRPAAATTAPNQSRYLPRGVAVQRAATR